MSFLQGLISNDIYLLDQQPSIYSCLLTPNGKFLFDFFIYKNEENICIECEGGERAEALLKRLNMFKLRANVSFDIIQEHAVFAILHGTPTNCSTYPDTRHDKLGMRTAQKPEDLEELSFKEWDKHRIKQGVPDGSRDMIPEKSTLLECNIDQLNGVSFKKGCFMGQELTARMHYRGLTKKTLIPVEFDESPPAPFTNIEGADGKIVAEMRSSCGNIGLVLIKKELLETPGKLPFKPLSF